MRQIPTLSLIEEKQRIKMLNFQERIGFDQTNSFKGYRFFFDQRNWFKGYCNSDVPIFGRVSGNFV